MKKRPEYSLKETGLRIRELRKERRISVDQVRRYMKFESAQAIYNWEQGKCFPQADNLLALAQLFEVGPQDIMVEKKENLITTFVEMIHTFMDLRNRYRTDIVVWEYRS